MTPRLELGAIFGYQRRDGSGSIPTTKDADDLTDLTIAPKLRLWQGLENKLKFGAHGPETADRIRYYAINFSRADFDDDRWYVGQTIRQMLNEKWTLLAEVFAFLPNTQAGGHANWYFSGGPQWSVGENVSFCALVGSAAGHKSPDLTGTLEVTVTF